MYALTTSHYVTVNYGVETEELNVVVCSFPDYCLQMTLLGLVRMLKDWNIVLGCWRNVCLRWGIKVNVEKSTIIHFRRNHVCPVTINFSIGGEAIPVGTID